MNIVIPMAGLGTRFSQEGFVLPKPLIEINGKKVDSEKDVDSVLKTIKTDEMFTIKIKHENIEKTIQLKKLAGNFNIQMRKGN